MISKILTLDLSTTCSGWAVFELNSKKLLSYGIVKPKVKGASKLMYPELQLMKMRDITAQIMELIKGVDELSGILVEEINRGKNRLGQKTLDGLHYILLDAIHDHGMLRLVDFRDSDGNSGWRSRSGLNLQLSATDKLKNKEAKKFNRKLMKNSRGKAKLITKKTLACNYVNKHYGLDLKENIAGGSDIADAIGLGAFYLHKVLR